MKQLLAMCRFNFHLPFVCVLSLFFGIACQINKPEPISELDSVDLLRGEPVLCGGDQFGKVSFYFTCKNSLRKSFNTAVSLLHSFEYDEAEKAFAKVIDGDPNCAMAYWGAAMSIINHPKFGPTSDGFEKGRKILGAAKNLHKSTREQEYFDAVNAYYQNDWIETSHLERARKMEQKVEEIYSNYQDDTEAAIFYALSLFATADVTDKTYSVQKKAGKILESLFPDQPNHPGIAHYIIHHYDNPDLAKLALPTARKYADIAPGSSHAQHMPSHIFTRLGLWDESIQSNINSAESARCYAIETEMDGNWHYEIHALDYLVYAYLQKGDNAQANELYEYWQTIDNEHLEGKSPYNFGAIPARMFVENKQWEPASKLSLHKSNHPWDQHPWESAILHFTRALGSARTGDISSTERELSILNSLHQQLVDKKDKYRANQVKIQVTASEAWMHFARGNHPKAVALMREAVDLEEKTGKHPVTPGEIVPAPELLGDMLLELNKPEEALDAYELNLQGHPNRFNGIYGAAVAAKEVGDKAKAKMYFESLLKLVESSNSNRREIEEAKSFLLDS